MKNADDVCILRIVVKENFSRDMADLLINDILYFSDQLQNNTKPKIAEIAKNTVHKHIC